jgi:hypothetical protein
MRLKVIAAERAPTIAAVIQASCHADGSPRAASTAPKKAKGSAKSVCSILIISSVVRTLRAALVVISSLEVSKCRAGVARLGIAENRRELIETPRNGGDAAARVTGKMRGGGAPFGDVQKRVGFQRGCQ